MHTYLHTYINAYLHTYTHTYIHSRVCACVRTYVRTYIHTCRHTYIHTYIRTYIAYIRKWANSVLAICCILERRAYNQAAKQRTCKCVPLTACSGICCNAKATQTERDMPHGMGWTCVPLWRQGVRTHGL
jgi:hypothetical protein